VELHIAVHAAQTQGCTMKTTRTLQTACQAAVQTAAIIVMVVFLHAAAGRATMPNSNSCVRGEKVTNRHTELNSTDIITNMYCFQCTNYNTRSDCLSSTVAQQLLVVLPAASCYTAKHAE